MSHVVTIADRPVHLSPTAIDALQDLLADQKARRPTPTGAIHPACRLRLEDLGLIELDRDDTIARLTDLGTDIAEQVTP